VTAARTVHIDYEPVVDIHGRVMTIANVARASYGGSSVGTDQKLAVYDYSYDDNGNRLTQMGHRPSSGPPGADGFAYARQVGYGYDNLNRVTQADYTYPAGVETAFDYDILGNRNAVYDSLNNVTRTYTANAANEYTSIGTNAVTQAVTYDMRGNLSRDDGFDADSSGFFEYTYDAENP